MPGWDVNFTRGSGGPLLLSGIELNQCAPIGPTWLNKISYALLLGPSTATGRADLAGVPGLGASSGLKQKPIHDLRSWCGAIRNCPNKVYARIPVGHQVRPKFGDVPRCVSGMSEPSCFVLDQTRLFTEHTSTFGDSVSLGDYTGGMGESRLTSSHVSLPGLRREGALIGRQNELEAFNAALGYVTTAGKGGLMFITGEAGIGWWSSPRQGFAE